jgi:hypothetical protein
MGYTPRDEEGERKTDGIWSKGHTDCERILPTSGLAQGLWSDPKRQLGLLVVFSAYLSFADLNSSERVEMG